MKAKFIVIDGLDGSGKSVAIEAISDILKAAGEPHVVLRAMGTGMIGEEVRRRMKEGRYNDHTESLLIAAGQIDAMETVNQHLEQDVTVIMDRWLGTFFAYQTVGNNCPVGRSIWQHVLKEGGYLDIKPSLELYCKVTPIRSQELLATRKNNPDPVDTLEAVDFDVWNERYVGFNVFFETRQHSGFNVVTVNNQEDKETFIREIKETFYSRFPEYRPVITLPEPPTAEKPLPKY